MQAQQNCGEDTSSWLRSFSGTVLRTLVSFIGRTQWGKGHLRNLCMNSSGAVRWPMREVGKGHGHKQRRSNGQTGNVWRCVPCEQGRFEHLVTSEQKAQQDCKGKRGRPRRHLNTVCSTSEAQILTSAFRAILQWRLRWEGKESTPMGVMISCVRVTVTSDNVHKVWPLYVMHLPWCECVHGKSVCCVCVVAFSWRSFALGLSWGNGCTKTKWFMMGVVQNFTQKGVWFLFGTLTQQSISRIWWRIKLNYVKLMN